MKKRLVIDTNIYISKLISRANTPSSSSTIKDFLLETKKEVYEIITCLEQVKELKEVSKRFDCISSENKRKVWSILKSSKFIMLKNKVKDCRDEKDNYLLSLAIEGNAKYLVTGDSDLLSLMPYKNIEILKPREFLEKIT